MCIGVMPLNSYFHEETISSRSVCRIQQFTNQEGIRDSKNCQNETAERFGIVKVCTCKFPFDQGNRFSSLFAFPQCIPGLEEILNLSFA